MDTLEALCGDLARDIALEDVSESAVDPHEDDESFAVFILGKILLSVEFSLGEILLSVEFSLGKILLSVEFSLGKILLSVEFSLGKILLSVEFFLGKILLSVEFSLFDDDNFPELDFVIRSVDDNFSVFISLTDNISVLPNLSIKSRDLSSS